MFVGGTGTASLMAVYLPSRSPDCHPGPDPGSAAGVIPVQGPENRGGQGVMDLTCAHKSDATALIAASFFSTRASISAPSKAAKV